MLEGYNLNTVFLIMGLTGVVPLILVWKSWQMGKSDEVRYFTYLMASCAAYSVFYTLELAALDLSVKVLFLKLQYVGAVFFGPFMFLLILNYSGKNVRNDRFINMVFIFPLVTLFMVFSNDLHFLFYGAYSLENNGLFEVLVTEKYFFYWLHQIYSLVLLLLSQVFIIEMIRNEPVSGSRQVKFVWIGMSFPLMAYAIHLMGIVPLNLDPIPLSFIGTGVFVFLGLTKYRLFKETPIVYKTLFESISDAVLVSDMEGKLVTCNPVASEFFKLEKDIREGSVKQCPEDGWIRLKEILEKSVGNEVIVFSWEKAGKLNWYSASRSPIFGTKGDSLGEIVVLRDVTSEKDYQQKLELAKEEADKANRSKSEFLANMSHEIRTPLNGVIGFTELLGNTPLSDQQRRYVSTAFNSANALLELINNVLDLSKIEAGKVELHNQEVNLPRLIRTISDVMSFQANKFGIEFLIYLPADVPNLILIDELKLKQILINLLNNAVKFTQEGDVALSVVVLERQVDGKVLLRFQVTDSGIGIDPKKQEMIFESFSQADASTTKQYGGTGLGLAISNRLLAIMGSRLHVESVVDEGSTFYFDVLVDVLHPSKINQELRNRFKTALLIGFTSALAKNTGHYLEQLGFNNRKSDDFSEAKGLLQNVGGIEGIFINQQLSDLEMNYPKLRDFIAWGKSRDLPPCYMLLPANVPQEVVTKFHSLGYTKRIIKPLMLDNLKEAMHEFDSPETVSDTALPSEEADKDYYHFKILVAEDNAVNRMLIRVYLGNIFPGITVLEAESGKRALQLFLSESPDLVISDIQMPEMDGYDLAKAIREHPAGKGIGIIALTANARNGEEKKCREVGFDDFVAKPIRLETFKEVVQVWMKNNP